MKMMAIPSADKLRREPSSVSASLSVSTAVGSSSTISFTFSRPSSRAISVNCLWPTGISRTSILGSSEIPSLSMAFFERLSMVMRSRVLMRFPKMSMRMELLKDSRLSRMFSVVVNPGISENS